MTMFPTEHHDNVYVYEHSFCVDDEFLPILERGASSDWSFVTFTTVAAGADDHCKSESASLFALTTDVKDEFLDFLREHITAISDTGLELSKDYFNSVDIGDYGSMIYDLLRFSKHGEQGKSVVLSSHLEEGIVVEIASLSPSPMHIEFPSLDLTVKLNQGDIMFAPGGFPFAHCVHTEESNILLKRQYR